MLLNLSHTNLLNRFHAFLSSLNLSSALALLAIFFSQPGQAETLESVKSATQQRARNGVIGSDSSFQKGIVYTSWRSGEYASPESDLTLSDGIKPTGANWISVVVTCYQDAINATGIQCKPETLTPTDDDLNHVIKQAHEQGLKVMIKPHIDLASPSSNWRGEIGFDKDEIAWKIWFTNYTKFITHYAKLAQDSGADYLVVGTELAKTVHRSRDWRQVIKAVRRDYRGPLTYAAHHLSGEASIDWWDALDAIGIDAYYPLSTKSNPSADELKDAWGPIVAKLGQLSAKWQRPIILTEVGYESLDASNCTPWKSEKEEIDFSEQAECYEGVFRAFAGQRWWQGVFWWNWTVNTARASGLNGDFSAFNKPAENVLRVNYGGQAQALPPASPLISSRNQNRLFIYRDALGKGWQDWSWNSSLSVAGSEQQENSELKMSIAPLGALSLHHSGLSTAPYAWLEFYLYVGDDVADQFIVSVHDSSDHEQSKRVELPDSKYIEGGVFLHRKWQRIRIPLADLDAHDMTITRLTIKDSSSKNATIYIDNISLIGHGASGEELVRN